MSLDERIGEDHAVRMIDTFVDGLDMDGLSFVRSGPLGAGRLRYPNTTYVPVKMYGSGKYPLQAIPNVAQDTPNHSLNRKGRAETKVVLTIRRDLGKQQIRKETVEHPFGTLKWYDGYHYFLCKGKEKVAAETALAFLSYNLRRAIRLTTGPNGGVPSILMHLMARNRAGWAC